MNRAWWAGAQSELVPTLPRKSLWWVVVCSAHSERSGGASVEVVERVALVVNVWPSSKRSGGGVGCQRDITAQRFQPFHEVLGQAFRFQLIKMGGSQVLIYLAR